MGKPEYDEQVWPNIQNQDLWVYDKLIVSRYAGHVCGPRGVNVPAPGIYMIKPITNVNGMGYGAEAKWVDGDTSFIPAGYFWCEMFYGEHLSIDYVDGKPSLSVIGIPDPTSPYQRFVYWETTDQAIDLPVFLRDLSSRYRTINCEFVGGKLIEVHLRGNPDFCYGNTVMIPVWPGDPVEPPAGMRFVPQDADDNDSDRVGIFVDI